MAYYMPDIPSDTRYFNVNQCYNIKFNLTGATNYVKSLSAVKCGEIVILNNTGNDVNIKGPGRDANGSKSVDPSTLTEFLIKDGQEFTFRGLTSSDQISAAGTNLATLHARTQWYSMTPQTAR